MGRGLVAEIVDLHTSSHHAARQSVLRIGPYPWAA